METTDNFALWAMGGASTIIASMALAVTALWKHSEGKDKKTIEILEAQCQIHLNQVNAMTKELFRCQVTNDRLESELRRAKDS